MKNINKLYSNKEIIRKFCNKIFGIDADPVNVNENNLHVDLYIVKGGDIISVFPTTLDEVLEKYTNVVSLIGNPETHNSMLAIHIEELKKTDIKLLDKTVYVITGIVTGNIKGVYKYKKDAKKYHDDEENMIVQSDMFWGFNDLEI